VGGRRGRGSGGTATAIFVGDDVLGRGAAAHGLAASVPVARTPCSVLFLHRRASRYLPGGVSEASSLLAQFWTRPRASMTGVFPVQCRAHDWAPFCPSRVLAGVSPCRGCYAPLAAIVA